VREISEGLWLIISCEHGGNRVPARYAPLFRGARGVLDSHRGYDPGSLDVGRRLARRFGSCLCTATVTRLLVECNRSPGHPALFSEFTAGLSRPEREELLQRYYFPHRHRVEGHVHSAVLAGLRVVHVSVHTFTPHWNGAQRSADVGLLYDPTRAGERQFCDLWRSALHERNPELRVRRNYPYRGQADGLTTWLRKRFTDAEYLGIELEVNQAWTRKDPSAWRIMTQSVIDAFASACREFQDA